MNGVEWIGNGYWKIVVVATPDGAVHRAYAIRVPDEERPS